MAVTRIAILLLVCCASLAAAQNATVSPSTLPVSNLIQRRQYPGDAHRFSFYPPSPAPVNNSAATLILMDVGTNPVVTTLPGPGLSQTAVRLAPCAILLPHVHPRGSEILFVINGTVSAGLAEENGGRIINFDVGPYQNFVIPVGLVHYSHNNNCQPVYFLQFFNSGDPGTITLPRTLLSFPVDAVTAFYNQTPEQVTALNSTLPGPPGAFALDQRCLARCGTPPASSG